MWTVVYMTKNEDEAINLTKKLEENGVISKIRKNDSFFEVLVPEAEMELAHSTIIATQI